jgi:hypothetical protein
VRHTFTEAGNFSYAYLPPSDDRRCDASHNDKSRIAAKYAADQKAKAADWIQSSAVDKWFF